MVESLDKSESKRSAKKENAEILAAMKDLIKLDQKGLFTDAKGVGLDKPPHKREDWDAVDDSILARFDLICKMGRGNYGTVWRAIDKSNRSKVAIKKINDAFANIVDA
jgi:serine/threonine protein kinase